MPICAMKPSMMRKKPAVVVEPVLDEVVEAIGAERRPGAVHGDHERALGRLESRLVGLRRLLGQRRRVLQLGQVRAARLRECASDGTARASASIPVNERCSIIVSFDSQSNV